MLKSAYEFREKQKKSRMYNEWGNGLDAWGVYDEKRGL